MPHPPTPVGEVVDFTLVVAVYGVERYLPDFLDSLDAQVHPHDRVQVVLVDDGSTDGSLELLRRWAERTDYVAEVLTQPNAGQGAARNTGLVQARAPWVTFPDPDDVLVPGYLAEVARGIAEHPEVDLVACPFHLLRDETGTITDDHPLRYRFGDVPKVRDLSQQPAYFFGSAPAGFFRRDRLEQLGLRFDDRIRPNFEDGHFVAHYLLATAEPQVLFEPAAVYQYRKRADDSSTLDGSLRDPRRYTDVFRHGYLDVLQHAVETRGEVPGWLNQLIVYDLLWLLPVDVRARAQTKPSLMAVAPEFHDLMTEIAPLLDLTVRMRLRWPQLNPLWRDALTHGWSSQRWAGRVRITRIDRVQRLVRLSYHVRGDRPEEVFEVDGTPTSAVHATDRPFEMLGRTLVTERVCWVPLGERLRVLLDGEVMTARVVPAGLDVTEVTREDLERHVRRVAEWPALGRRDRRFWVRRLAMTPPWRSRFARAWVLMDRVHDADDSGERLFEHLREHRPDINAWFVIQRGTPGWRSLRARYGSRVVAHGSLQWELLLHHAEHVISSHADAAVVRPEAIVRPGDPSPARLTFLQHGVIKDDLSSWLNPKNLDVFVTSTQAEHESVAASGTQYTYSTREVALTGLPRFDRLRRLGLEAPESERNLVLVSPTWRNWLAKPLETGSQRRFATDDFLDSEFASRWLALVASGRLRSVAEEHGLEIVFLPHPNLQGHLDDVEIPPHVRLSGFDGVDVQQLFARCRLMVTDYSSMAFNAAYLDRPVVYYQFDRDRVLGGEHVGVGGYFDYYRDGYGPVTTEHDETCEQVVDLARTGRLRPEHQARVEQAFPQRDGRCCERTVAAIERAGRPMVP